MKKLLLLLALCLAGVAQAQTGAVTKSTASATLNDLTTDINVPSGKTATVKAGGTLNASAGTLTLANSQVGWAAVNKTGASLADLPTRNFADLQNTAAATPTFAGLTLTGNASIGAATGAPLFRATAFSEGGPALSFTGDDDTGLWRSAADTLQLVTAGVARVTVANSNLGIGTTAPATKLEVAGEIRASSTGIVDDENISLKNGTRQWNLRINGAADTFSIRDVTAGVDRLTITNAGGVQINATSTFKGVRTATATLDFGIVSAQDQAGLNVTVTGAAAGDTVVVNSGDGTQSPVGIILHGTVTAANTVNVRASNISAAPIDPPSQSIRVTVISF